MEQICEWPCWKIMNCDISRTCPARSRPGTPCWEIAGELNDYRQVLDICRDCIVHMLKDDNSVLTEHEMKSILIKKANCALA